MSEAAGADRAATEAANAAPAAAASRPVVLLDLGCVQPFYCAYLCRALREAGADATLASIAYHLEPGFFSARGLHPRPGAVDLVGRLGLPPRARRPLKALEYCLNLALWTLRLTARPAGVVHAQQLALADAGLPVDRWAVQWLRRRGHRIVHTVHNLTPHDTLPGRSGERRRAEFARLYRGADALICHGVEARQLLISEFGVAAERVHVIPHGLMFHEAAAAAGADRARWELPPEDNIFLFQGFLKPYKGLDWLLSAWRRARERGLAAATLVIAGAGDAAVIADVRAQISGDGLGDAVRLLDRYLTAEEVNSLYRAADVAVYPYREITSSGAVMTGIGHGKAILATDLPLFRELLGEPPEAALAQLDDADSLAAQLLALAASPQRRAQLAAASRARAQQVNSWRDIATATMSVYAAIVA